MKRGSLIIGDLKNCGFSHRIAIGIDPSLSACGFWIPERYGECIDGSSIKWTNLYDRTFQIAQIICNRVLSIQKNKEIYLIMESSTFSKNSKSLEQLASVRQAIYDAFAFTFHEKFKYFIEVNPSQRSKFLKEELKNIKKSIYSFTGKFEAILKLEITTNIKERVFWHNYLTVTAFREFVDNRPDLVWCTPSKGKNKGIKILTKEIEAISDACLVAEVGTSNMSEDNKVIHL